jgi:lipopolysaccharide exporter
MSNPQPPDAYAPGAPLSSVELEGQILRNTGWVALSLGAAQVASLLAMFVLARLLDPKEFGLVALAWTVLTYAEQIQEGGIGQALIYRRKDVETAAASALVFAPLVSILLYSAVFGVAPFAASFLHAPALVDVLRVMALVLVFRGLAVVPRAILERDLDFRSMTIAELAGTAAQVGVFLGLAFAGFGVWSLVLGNLAAAALQTALYWVLVPWRPSVRRFNRRILLELTHYGRVVGAANVLSVVSNTVDNIVVSRALGTTSLGFYSIAYRLADFPSSVVGHIVGRTMFSVYSTLQHDRAAFRHAYVRNLQRLALLAVPISVGLVLAAHPIVVALLGEKWEPAVPALRILAAYGVIKSFGSTAVDALRALGEPRWGLILGVVYAVVAIPALVLLTLAFGLTGAALSMLIAISASSFPAVAISARRVELSARELARSLAPSALCSLLLAVALGALLVSTRSLGSAALLGLLVAAGIAVYGTATALFARSVVSPMWLGIRAGRKP